MKPIIVAFAICLSLAVCPMAFAQSVVDAGMVQLIANPERFHGKKIRIVGFLKLEFEGTALYLHREDYEQGIFAHSTWVQAYSLGQRERDAVSLLHIGLSDQYVLLEGTFDATQRGHLGMFQGTIFDVTRAEKWPPRLNPEPKK